MAADDRIRDPLRLARRNCAAALASIGLAGLGCLARYAHLDGPVAWWAWPAVAAFVVAACVGQAALAARIGERRATRVFLVPLAAGLVVGVWCLTRWIAARR